MSILTKNELRDNSTPYLIQVRKAATYDWITYQGLWPDKSAVYSDEEVEQFAIDQGDAIMEYVIAHSPDFWELYDGIRVIKILAYTEG
jgi:hypothetical protein